MSCVCELISVSVVFCAVKVRVFLVKSSIVPKVRVWLPCMSSAPCSFCVLWKKNVRCVMLPPRTSCASIEMFIMSYNMTVKPCKNVGRDSSVGIATRYGLDGPGIESRWWRDFPHPSKPTQGPTQPPIRDGYRVFPGGKAAGAWR